MRSRKFLGTKRKIIPSLCSPASFTELSLAVMDQLTYWRSVAQIWSLPWPDLIGGLSLPMSRQSIQEHGRCAPDSSLIPEPDQFEYYVKLNWKPVQTLLRRNDVFLFSGAGNEPGSCISGSRCSDIFWDFFGDRFVGLSVWRCFVRALFGDVLWGFVWSCSLMGFAWRCSV